MSFIRPDVTRQMRKWAEPIVGAAVIFVGIWMALRGYGRANLILELLGGGIAIFGVVYTISATRRVLFAGDAQGAGYVEVTERRISYLAPIGGGFADIADITRIEARHAPDLGRCWIVHHMGGPTLFIPMNAAGGEALFDAFLALPGMDQAGLVAAARNSSVNPDVIWQVPAKSIR